MIREAKFTDYRAIRKMLGQGVAEGTLKSRSRWDVARNLKRFVIAETGGQVYGMASVKVYDRRLAEVRSVYVSPAQRHNGTAKDLIQRVIEQPVKRLPSGTIFAITTTPGLFESADNYGTQQGDRHIVFKNI